MLGVVNTMTTLIPLHDIPSYSRSSKNGGSRTIEAANQELSLTLEDVEDMVFVFENIWVNGKKVDSIKIKLNYKDFEAVPKE